MSKSPENTTKYYNVKLLRNYVNYLKDKLDWKEDQVDMLFFQCNSDQTFITSDDNWYDQAFCDLFHETIVQMTNDADIAYKVGRYTTTDTSKGVGGRFVQGFVSVKTVYKNIKKIASYYTKSSYYEPVYIDSEKAIIRSIVSPGCDEKSFQCRNRIGVLASIPSLFDCTNVKITHDVCFHKNGKYCEYEIIWHRPLKFRPLPVSLFSSIISFVVFFIVTNYHIGWSFLAAAVGAIIGYEVVREFLSYRLQKTLKVQQDALEESVQTLERRHKESDLLRTIISSTTEMMPIDSLCKRAVDLIRNKMQYDRAMILLFDEEKSILRTKATSGYIGRPKELLEAAEFRVRSDNFGGYFIKIVNTKKPVLIRNAQSHISQLSERSKRLLKLVGTESFVAVPILIGNKVLGIIAVENIDRSKPLASNDLDLMMGLANHLAVAFSNAQSYESMKRSLRIASDLEERQRQIKELFQKYVPGEVINAHEEDGYDKILHLQKKILSVMFIDIINFTQLSEKMSPEEIAEILDIYIEHIFKEVDESGGKINKIMGDGMLIYFDPEYYNVISAGYNILNSLSSINKKLKDLGYSPITISLGAHQGMCTLGNIGSKQRLDYTLIGDAVNTASRIEGLTREFGPNTFCFSTSLLEEVQGYRYESKGFIDLKGKEKPIEIFKLLI